MIRAKHYKAGDEVILIGYPDVTFKIKEVFSDSLNNVIYRLLGTKTNGQKIKFDKDESYILCSVEEFKEVYS